MNNYLDNQPPVYNRFINNQVLTESQLNALLNHLNYQDKATRTLLTGAGIVCGLEVSLSPNGRQVRLTKGVGVTSDGDLINPDQTDYTAFKEFEDTNARYPKFIRNNKTISLWELRESDEASDVHPLNRFTSTAGFELNRAIALLYLEYYYKEPEDCSPVDCNSQGKEVVARPRLLLISENDAEFISEQDSVFSDVPDKHSAKGRDVLETLYAHRVIHTNFSAGNTEFADVYRVSFDEIISKLNGLSKYPVLTRALGNINVNYTQRLRAIASGNAHSQYVYGFYKDLTEAINILTGLLKQNISICSPDVSSFPKHLLLGTIREERKDFRHRFYPSPALQKPAAVWKIQKAYRRILLMIRDFQTGLESDIRITPSLPYKRPLGERSIPVYYDLKTANRASVFVENWRNNGSDPVPNYFGYGYPSSFKPLDVYLQGHDFYRVEGHIGQPLFNALQDLKKIKQTKGLPFKILPIAAGSIVDERSIDFDDYKAYFEDLQVVLKAWNEEHQCLMQSASRFLSGFSIEQPGKHSSFIEKEAHHIPAVTERHTETFVHGMHDFHQPLFYEAYYTPAREFKSRNIVLEGVNKTEGTVGNILINNIKTSDTANDIRAKYTEWFGGRLNQIDETIIDITVRKPIELIGFMKETEDRKITDIRDFTPENMRRYIASLEEQCARFKKTLVDVQKVASSQNVEVLGSAEWLGTYMQIMHRLSESCCLAEKVKVLYQTIIERKEELFSQFRLHTFLDKHPGAEHLAGVPKGGTFILLYSAGRGRLRLNEGIVIGDLCLPYICCSGTPPATFVVPEEKTGLRLPTDHICKPGTDINEIRLDVTPARGEVKAFIDDNELQSAIIQNESGTYFNPNRVNVGDFGKPIRFTVNEQNVDARLTIHRMPEPAFTIDDNIQFSRNNTIAAVRIRNTTKNRNEFNFQWDFGGNQLIDNNNAQFVHEFSVQPGREFTGNITVRASNDHCTATASERVTFQVPVVETPEPEPVPEPPPRVNCRVMAETNLTRSTEALDRFYQSVPAVQRRRAQIEEIHDQFVIPFYKDMINELDVSLSGEMDEKVRELIQGVQGFVLTNVINSNNQPVQQYAMLLFMEMILLWLAIHLCRENVQITLPELLMQAPVSFDITHDRRGTETRREQIDWVKTTEMFAGQFSGQFRTVLQRSGYVESFTETAQFLTGRLSRQLRTAITNIHRLISG